MERAAVTSEGMTGAVEASQVVVAMAGATAASGRRAGRAGTPARAAAQSRPIHNSDLRQRESGICDGLSQEALRMA